MEGVYLFPTLTTNIRQQVNLQLQTIKRDVDATTSLKFAWWLSARLKTKSFYPNPLRLHTRQTHYRQLRPALQSLFGE